jgi:hypothetical protein
VQGCGESCEGVRGAQCVSPPEQFIVEVLCEFPGSTVEAIEPEPECRRLRVV